MRILLQKGTNSIKITTQNAYDPENQEFFKLPNNIFQTLYFNLVSNYTLYELYQSNEQHDKVKANQVSVKLNSRLFKKLLCRRDKYIIFEEVDPSKFEEDFIFEMHLVVTKDIRDLIGKLKESSIKSFGECKMALSQIAPAVISICDSSDINISFLDEGLVDVALRGLQDYICE